MASEDRERALESAPEPAGQDVDELAAAIDAAAIEPPNGVLVTPVYQDNGDVQVNIKLVGDVRALEIPALLLKAYKLVQQGMGLNE